MSHKVTRRVLCLFILTILTSLLVVAEDHSAVVGKWNMSSESDNGAVEWSLVVKEADGKLTAFLATDGGEQPAKNFTYADGVLKFVAPYQGEDYNIELKVQGDKLVGTWSGGGNDGRTTGMKSKS